jgi:catechol 2,3-dioxygenase-like lactoylglutathione lyase family enzyme
MLDHVGISVSDYKNAKAFYVAALEPLGITCIMEVTPEETGGAWYGGFGKAGKPDFWIGTGHKASSNVHVAFQATRPQVDAFYKAALAEGAKDNGPPGIRLDYHPNYYAAFVLDADGNNIEAVCQTPA